MTDDDSAVAADLHAVAEYHAARRTIDNAIAELAARPLSERAADRMRTALAAPEIAQARAALLRLAPHVVIGAGPHLAVVGSVSWAAGDDSGDCAPGGGLR